MKIKYTSLFMALIELKCVLNVVIESVSSG